MKLLAFCYYDVTKEERAITLPDRVRGLQSKIAKEDKGDEYYYSVGYSQKHIDAARLHKYPLISLDEEFKHNYELDNELR
jgi:hypothetical protein